MNTPSTFHRLMDQLFRELRFVPVYIDELVVFWKSIDEHVAHLTEVFRIISENGRKLKISICSFAQSQIRLLGHISERPRDHGRPTEGHDYPTAAESNR